MQNTTVKFTAQNSITGRSPDIVMAGLPEGESTGEFSLLLFLAMADRNSAPVLSKIPKQIKPVIQGKSELIVPKNARKRAFTCQQKPVDIMRSQLASAILQDRLPTENNALSPQLNAAAKKNVNLCSQQPPENKKAGVNNFTPVKASINEIPEDVLIETIPKAVSVDLIQISDQEKDMPLQPITDKNPQVPAAVALRPELKNPEQDIARPVFPVDNSSSEAVDLQRPDAEISSPIPQPEPVAEIMDTENSGHDRSHPVIEQFPSTKMMQTNQRDNREIKPQGNSTNVPETDRAQNILKQTLADVQNVRNLTPAVNEKTIHKESIGQFSSLEMVRTDQWDNQEIQPQENYTNTREADRTHNIPVQTRADVQQTEKVIPLTNEETPITADYGASGKTATEFVKVSVMPSTETAPQEIIPDSSQNSDFIIIPKQDNQLLPELNSDIRSIRVAPELESQTLEIITGDEEITKPEMSAIQTAEQVQKANGADGIPDQNFKQRSIYHTRKPKEFTEPPQHEPTTETVYGKAPAENRKNTAHNDTVEVMDVRQRVFSAPERDELSIRTIHQEPEVEDKNTYNVKPPERQDIFSEPERNEAVIARTDDDPPIDRVKSVESGETPMQNRSAPEMDDKNPMPQVDRSKPDTARLQEASPPAENRAIHDYSHDIDRVDAAVTVARAGDSSPAAKEGIPDSVSSGENIIEDVQVNTKMQYSEDSERETLDRNMPNEAQAQKMDNVDPDTASGDEFSIPLVRSEADAVMPGIEFGNTNLPTAEDPQITASLSELPEKLSMYVDNMDTSGEASSISIQLEPKNLGKIKFRVSVKDSKVLAKISVISPETRELIEAQIPDIRRNLAQNEVEITELSIHLENNSSGSDPRNSGFLRDYSRDLDEPRDPSAGYEQTEERRDNKRRRSNTEAALDLLI